MGKVMVGVIWLVVKMVKAVVLIMSTHCQGAHIELVFVIARYRNGVFRKKSREFTSVTNLS